MIKVNGYSNYFGGKSGNGTYQTIINHIPPHKYFYSLFLGNCGVTRFIRPAEINYLNDIDKRITDAWEATRLPGNYKISNQPALTFLSIIAESCDTAGEHFIYLDPPYKLSSRKSAVKVYKFELTDSDHSDLLSQIVAMAAKGFNIMISHYPDREYDQVLSSWHTHDFYSTIRNGVALERIYYNYELTEQLHDYSFIGEDFREREALARVKKNFVKKLNRLPAQLRAAILQELKTK
jgi:site-specific DNA-adenine methylase